MCALLMAALAAGCGVDRGAGDVQTLTGGDPDSGRVAMKRFGCGACHTIAGIPGANTLVGPPLTGIAQRSFIGGVLPNSPENLVKWIQDPQAIDPKSAMPNLGVSQSTARSMAAYLYTLK